MRMDARSEQRRRLRLTLAWLLACGTIVLALVTFGLSRGATAASGTTPDVDISADKLELNPGDTLSVRIRVTNPLTRTLDRITVKLDYDRGQITPIDSDFNRDSDWVSDLSDSRVTVAFKDIGAGKSRTGRVLFRVNQPAPGNTTVDLHARFNWSVDASASNPSLSGSGSTDGDEPLIVAPDGVLTNSNVIDSQPQAAIEPRSGGAGGLFRAYASGFRGGERISIWLNTPSGIAAIPHDLIANSNGEVWPEFSSSGLAPGSYGLVIYGQESTQTLVVPFTVSGSAVSQPPAAPQPAVAPQSGGATFANIEPKSAGSGTQFHAYARGFRGGERISIWLNTPSGIAAVPHDLIANANGEVWPEFSSSDLAPGSYGLVIYGQESTLTLVAPFTIGAGPAPAALAQPAAAVPSISLEPLGLWGASVPATSAPPAQSANIEPKNASAGAQFHAYARGFQDGEPVSIWLNTPGGVQALDGSFTANSAGEVWPEFSSDGLAPGSYGLVIYGRTSGQTIVVPFGISS
jgi:hypothetical protein